ncbi:hypothetical protein C8R44DRAFT_878891 [Mycena epipterygia]|nr:hypothetical protein C8R44DRAFT_878891 [Mycena epipterygia]
MNHGIEIVPSSTRPFLARNGGPVRPLHWPSHPPTPPSLCVAMSAHPVFVPLEGDTLGKPKQLMQSACCKSTSMKSVTVQGPRSPKPFTEALPFYNELFHKNVGDIYLAEDPAPFPGADDSDPSPADRYDEAAAGFRGNILWKSVKHVNETSCQTAIDLILLDLAQQPIAERLDVDEALCALHWGTGSKCLAHGREVRKWVVSTRRSIPPATAFTPWNRPAGICDYLLGVLPSSTVQKSNSREFLTRHELYAFSDLVPYITKDLTRASVVKGCKITMEDIDKKAWVQVTAQGAALCVLTNRPSHIFWHVSSRSRKRQRLHSFLPDAAVS